jgi:hypothetical protein
VGEGGGGRDNLVVDVEREKERRRTRRAAATTTMRRMRMKGSAGRGRRRTGRNQPMAGGWTGDWWREMSQHPTGFGLFGTKRLLFEDSRPGGRQFPPMGERCTEYGRDMGGIRHSKQHCPGGDVSMYVWMGSTVQVYILPASPSSSERRRHEWSHHVIPDPPRATRATKGPRLDPRGLIAGHTLIQIRQNLRRRVLLVTSSGPSHFLKSVLYNSPTRAEHAPHR